MIALVACSSGTPQLMNLRNTRKARTSSPCCRPRRWKSRKTWPPCPNRHRACATASTPTRRRRHRGAWRKRGPRARGAGSDLVSYTTRFGVSERHPPGPRRRGRGLPPPQRRSHPRTHVRHQRLFRGVSTAGAGPLRRAGAPAPHGRTDAGRAAVCRVGARHGFVRSVDAAARSAYLMRQTQCSIRRARMLPLLPRRPDAVTTRLS
jgi:hypothetical protein